MTIHAAIDNAAVAAAFVQQQGRAYCTSFLHNDFERTMPNIHDMSVPQQQQQQQQHHSLHLHQQQYLSNCATKSESIKYWNKAKFLQWIGALSDSNADYQFKYSKLSLENVIGLTDAQVRSLLTNMDVNEFLKLDEKFGKMLFDELYEMENANSNNKQNILQNIKCDSLAASSDSSLSSDSSMPFIPSLIPNVRNNSTMLSHKNSNFLRVGNGKIVKHDKKTKDCVHVWQFCRDLLQDSKYNPNIIEWINQKELVFKINKKEEIALLWGKKKNRKSPEKMTYENMSRGMRHSRVASDYFKVPDKKLKKKFVYQFGDKAIDNCSYLKSLKFGFSAFNS